MKKWPRHFLTFFPVSSTQPIWYRSRAMGHLCDVLHRIAEEVFDIFGAEAKELADFDGSDPWIFAGGVVTNPAGGNSQQIRNVRRTEQPLIVLFSRSCGG